MICFNFLLFESFKLRFIFIFAFVNRRSLDILNKYIDILYYLFRRSDNATHLILPGCTRLHFFCFLLFLEDCNRVLLDIWRNVDPRLFLLSNLNCAEFPFVTSCRFPNFMFKFPIIMRVLRSSIFIPFWWGSLMFGHSIGYMLLYIYRIFLVL